MPRSRFSEVSRRLAGAAKREGIIGTPEDHELLEELTSGQSFLDDIPEDVSYLVDEPVGPRGYEKIVPVEPPKVLAEVPLDRRRNVPLNSMSDEEIDRAHKQAAKRLEDKTPQDKDYERYRLYLNSIEAFIEARAPEPEPEPPPSRTTIPVNDDGLPWEAPKGTPTYRNDRSLNFRGAPNDTPGTD